jgi:hypothetical protein
MSSEMELLVCDLIEPVDDFMDQRPFILIAIGTLPATKRKAARR